MSSTPGPIHPLLTSGEEYPFVKLERRRRELAPQGVASINFGMGDPREETPLFIRDALKRAVPAVSSYPATNGKPDASIAMRDKIKEGARDAVKSGVAKSARAAAEAAGLKDPRGLEAIEKAAEAAIQEKGKPER